MIKDSGVGVRFGFVGTDVHFLLLILSFIRIRINSYLSYTKIGFP